MRRNGVWNRSPAYVKPLYKGNEAR